MAGDELDGTLLERAQRYIDMGATNIPSFLTALPTATHGRATAIACCDGRVTD